MHRIWNDINTIRPYQIFFSFFIKTNFIIITMIVCLKMLLSVCCDESAIKSLFYRTWEHFGEWFIKRPYNNEINNLIFVRVKIYFSKKFNVRDILNYKIAYLSLWERKEIFLQWNKRKLLSLVFGVLTSFNLARKYLTNRFYPPWKWSFEWKISKFERFSNFGKKSVYVF